MADPFSILDAAQTALNNGDELSAKIHLNDLSICTTLDRNLRISAIELARSMDDILLATTLSNNECGDYLNFQLLLESGRDSSTYLENVDQSDNDLFLAQCSAILDRDGYKSAVKTIQNRIEKNSEWIGGHRYLSETLWQNGETEIWDINFSDFLYKNPKNIVFLAQYISLLISTENFDKLDSVVYRFRLVIEKSPLLTMLAADAYSNIGQPEQAELFFGRIPIDADPDFDLTRLRHFVRYNKIDSALNLAEYLVRSAGKIEAWAWLGFLWRLKGDSRSDWFQQEMSLIKVVDLKLDQQMLRDLTNALGEMHNHSSNLLGQSAKGGSQTLGHLFRRTEPHFQKLREKLRYEVRAYIDGLPAHDDLHPILGRNRKAFKFQGAWSIRLNSGGRHVPHIHSHGWLSSALYLSLPECIHNDSHDGSLQIGQPLLPTQPVIEPITYIKPAVGHLALFPSIFWHGTLPFEDGQRLAVAFDVRPR